MTRTQEIHGKYFKNSVLHIAVNEDYPQTLDFGMNIF